MRISFSGNRDFFENKQCFRGKETKRTTIRIKNSFLKNTVRDFKKIKY